MFDDLLFGFEKKRKGMFSYAMNYDNMDSGKWEDWDLDQARVLCWSGISVFLVSEKENLRIQALINYYVREKYTLRYTGGMVPDVFQDTELFHADHCKRERYLDKSVISPSSKAKLRLLFEVAPLGFLIEKAGGFSSDGTQSVLDKVINNLDERTQVAYGSKNEIIRFEETLYGSSRLKAGVPVGAAL